MKIIEIILSQIGGISKPQQKFILGLFSTIFIVYGKVNFTNLSRYGEFSEKTYRRQFGKQFPFKEFNQSLIEQALPEEAEKIAVVDCSFIAKSGKHTYGKDYFFNGCAGKPQKGLEISAITIVDVKTHTGYVLTVQQTPAQKKPFRSSSEIQSQTKTTSNLKKKSTNIQKPSANKKLAKQRQSQEYQETEATRIDFYLEQVVASTPYLTQQVKYIVADGNYAKEKFVNGIIKLKMHCVGKLRIDANLRYLYTGEQKSRGARRKYDGKVNLRDTSHLTFVKEVEPQVYLYTAIVNHISLKRNMRIAYLIDRRHLDKPGYALLFSTDIALDAIDIYRYYKARFQIEFIFRDAKQFTGLVDCQSRAQQKLDFHFNASLTALNLAKFASINSHPSPAPFVFSMATYKRLSLNDYLLDTFISMLELEPSLIKNHPNYQTLRSIGALAA